MNNLPLSGIRVLDLTRLFPGALCTLILADLGAEVIKVEAPGGDYMRHMLPASFAALNRNKSSVTLNLKTESGRGALLALTREADVFIDSFRPGVLDRLGLGVEHLQAANPRLVIASLTGYGQGSPRAREAGHDLNFTALAGLLGGIDLPPTIQIADLGGALTAANAILAALFRRERSGQGAVIDAALIDGALLAGIMLRAEAEARQVPPDFPREVLSGGLACYGMYRTADNRQMALAALESGFFEAFCETVDRPDLIPAHLDPARQDWLRGELADLFASRTRDAWTALLDGSGADTCCTPALDVLEAAADPAVQSRQMWVGGPDGAAHTRTTARCSGMEPPEITPAPDNGEDAHLLPPT